jgi:prepilin-type N-terminal cleavage/methylation domain-containing protein
MTHIMPGSKKGFTILELLVASAVSVILLGLFLSVSTNILDAWGQSRDSLFSNATARIVLDTIASDLESAILRSDEGVWLACDLSLNQGPSGRWESSVQQKPTGAESLEIDFDDPELTTNDFRFGVAGSWVRFFASPVDASESGDSGDINAIGYQVIRRKPHSRSSEAEESYNLYRAVVRADRTLEEVIEDEGYFIDEFDGDSYEGQAGEIIAPRNDSSMLARDVVDFGIVFYVHDSLGNKEILFPIPTGPTSFRVAENAIPTSAQIFVRILDEEGAKQLSAYERGLIPTSDSKFWWNTVNQFSTVYTRWIQFKGGDI